MRLALRTVLAVATVATLSVAALAPRAAAQIVFEPPLAADGGGLLASVIAGDVDEDGVQDVIVSHWVFGGSITLNLGLGGGAFAPAIPVPGASTSFAAFGLADLDGDTHLDLVSSTGIFGQTKITVTFGDGDGNFGDQLVVSGSYQNGIGADIGDFNGDGALDLAISNGSFGFTGGSILAALGNGDGSFAEAVTVASQFQVTFGAAPKLRAGDLNGDGRDDILFTAAIGSPVRLGQADGTFATPACTACIQVTDRDFVLADVNGDGREDAVTCVRVLTAQADGTLAFGALLSNSQSPFAVDVGDFDGDGLPDVAIGRNGVGTEFDPSLTVGDVLVLRGNGDGSFQTPGLVVSHVPQPRGVELADFDGDGRLDVAAAEFQQTPASLRVLLNHTYGPGSPFLDLGGALAGTHGYPIQLASGTLLAGQPFSFRLANGPANGSAYHIVGLAALNAPFKGGLMIPLPALINGPFPLDAAGNLTLAGNWPAGGAGLTIYVQFWMPNGGGPAGFVASSGVRAQIP